MDTDKIIDKIKATTPIELKNDKLKINRKVWVVEGDIGLGKEDLLSYVESRIELAKKLKGDPTESRHGLVAIESKGKILRWKPGKVLTYCVWKPSFPTDNEYNRVVKDMALAAADWEGICGIKFSHEAALDTKQDLTLGEVLFPVVRQSGGGNTIAMAFFPNSPINERIVFVFDGHFAEKPAFDPRGVLRHELGHVLGFRHEHIRPEAPDFFNPESTDHTVNLTEYDPKSVMHYVAPGVGNPKLEFTELDKTAAVKVYGSPHTMFTFED